jgi:predicted phosphoribosyltransferase
MFTDRKQAALALAGALEKYRGNNVVIAGIPRGGIETAYYVARHLDAALSFIIARKLSYPGDTEYALGAMAEDGTVYCNPNAKYKISQEMIDEIEDEQQKEIERRKLIYRAIQVFPHLKDKIVIIVDDGIATGATISAVIKMCKKREAGKIVVAAPVAAKITIKRLLNEADEVVILEQPRKFYAVSQFYASFRNLTDQEALAFLNKWENEKNTVNR